MADQRPKPVAACTICRAVSYSANSIEGQCGRWIANTNCDGIYERAMRTTDWEICPNCVGSGTSNRTECGHCGGSGWLCVRGLRPEDPDALDEYLNKRKS